MILAVSSIPMIGFRVIMIRSLLAYIQPLIDSGQISGDLVSSIKDPDADAPFHKIYEAIPIQFLFRYY